MNEQTPEEARPTFTGRQTVAWRDTVRPTLWRHGIDAMHPERSHYWTLAWADEVRPGRGHHLNAQFIDGEHYAQVLMDVYGYPSISVAALDWLHASSDEEKHCETCADQKACDCSACEDSTFRSAAPTSEPIDMGYLSIAADAPKEDRA